MCERVAARERTHRGERAYTKDKELQRAARDNAGKRQRGGPMYANEGRTQPRAETEKVDGGKKKKKKLKKNHTNI